MQRVVSYTCRASRFWHGAMPNARKLWREFRTERAVLNRTIVGGKLKRNVIKSYTRKLAGIASVTKQSGKSRQVLMRYRCNQRLRNVFYHGARTSIQHDPRSKHHYARLRQVGHNHGRALRGVADRLLSVLIAMLKSGQTYDPNRRSPADLTAA